MIPFQDPALTWNPVPARQLQSLERLLQLSAHARLGKGKVLSGRGTSLSFYQHYVLFEYAVATGSGEPVPVYLLAGHERGPMLWLDGTSAPIHQANEIEKVSITTASIIAYLRFFMYFVRGEEGQFVMIEDPAQFLQGGASDGHLAALRALVEPLDPQPAGEEGGFRVRVLVSYAGSIFRCDMRVMENGSLEMTDDHPLALLDGAVIQPGFELLSNPFPQRHAVAPPSPEDSDPAPGPQQVAVPDSLVTGRRKPPRIVDRDITHAYVSVLLEDAIKAQLRHRLLQRFNSETGGVAPAEQLRRFCGEFHPIIAIESDIEFIEDLVKDILHPAGAGDIGVVRATHSGGDGTYQVNVERGAGLWLFSFHMHQKVADVEWVAHALTLGYSTVLIGCASVRDIPDPLRRSVDLVLTLPRLTPQHFVRIFQRIFKQLPPAQFSSYPPGWQGYLLHSDFHAPVHLDMSPEEAMAHIYERSQARLAHVSADAGPSLHELHGMAEARQVAEDLIADISAARCGEIPWAAVDRGLLLVGKPGTGKTTLARAIAKSCGVKFIQASAAQWQSAGALDQHLRAIRASFSEARRYAPAILFIDEIDSIGNRETLSGHNAIYQTEVINAVLEQVQGMDENAPVILLAATNFLEKVDPALQRAGRLDQVVHVPLPNVPALEQIFAYHLRVHRAAGQVATDVDEKQLATLTFGSSGADVEFFVRGAARRARKTARSINQADLLAEVTRRPRHDASATRLSPAQMERVAYHEAGHALSILYSAEDVLTLTYISIVPRLNGSLGFTGHVAESGAMLTRRALQERLCTLLAGRAAEEIIYGPDNLSTGSGGGAGSDLAVATGLALQMAGSYGFGAQGNLAWRVEVDAVQRQEADDLLHSAYAQAKRLLLQHQDVLRALAGALIERQELSRRDVDELLGAQPAPGVAGQVSAAG